MEAAADELTSTERGQLMSLSPDGGTVEVEAACRVGSVGGTTRK
jgi:hypothetical protein